MRVVQQVQPSGYGVWQPAALVDSLSMAAEPISRMGWSGHTTRPSGYFPKIYFRSLKRFPKESRFETAQDRTEPIALGSVNQVKAADRCRTTLVSRGKNGRLQRSQCCDQQGATRCAFADRPL